MRASAPIFVTALFLSAAAASAGDAAMKQAANSPRPASAMKTVDINEVVNPSDTLAEAKVEDTKGVQIGQVQKVVTAETGTVGRLVVALKSDQKTVALTPEQVRYVPFSGKLRTAMTADQVSALPPAKAP
jgi:hypothetical protein